MAAVWLGEVRGGRLDVVLEVGCLILIQLVGYSCTVGTVGTIGTSMNGFQDWSRLKLRFCGPHCVPTAYCVGNV